MTYYNENARWDLIPDHMRSPVERYVMDGAPGGGFMTAVFSGSPLTEVVARADEENQAALIGWAKFLYNDVPGGCHGSEERYRSWIESGGINGQRRARQAA